MKVKEFIKTLIGDEEMTGRDVIELGPYPAGEFIRRTEWDFTDYGLTADTAKPDEAILIRFVVERDGIWGPVTGYRITTDIGPDEYGGWGNTVSEDACDPRDQELVLDSLEQVLQEMEGWSEEETEVVREKLVRAILGEVTG